MYRPGPDHHKVFEALIQNDTWDKVKTFYHLYKKKWNGPDIPIYIFPIESGGRLFQANQKKSGVSFPNMLFLFLSKIEDDLEIEALFIHEYHHICRMSGLKKSIEEYTLLDSLILEGLAEDAVHEHLGSKYVADCHKNLSDADFQVYWQKYLEKNLALKKSEQRHDHLLYGKGFLPKMLGYSCGYHLIRNYRQKYPYSTKESFILPSEKFVINTICQA